MSSIRKSDSGIWHYHRYFHPPNGETERIHRSLSTRDRQKAERKQSSLDDKYDALERGENAKTVPEAIEEYLEWRERRVKMDDLSESTLRMDEYGIKQLVRWLDEEDRSEDLLKSITTGDIEDLMFWRMEQVAKSSTGANMIHLKRFFSYATEHHWIEHNPFDGVKIPDTGSKPSSKVPSKGEWETINEEAERMALDDPDPRPIDIGFYILVKTGMRIGALVRLKWQRGPEDHGTDHSRTYAYLKGEGPTATAVIYHKKTRREIPIGGIWEAIDRLPRENQWLFPSDRRQDKHIRPNGWSRQISQILSALGFEKYSAHSLRHAFITGKLRKDTSVKKISNYVGHRTETLIDRYSHLLPSDLEDLVNPRGT